jgi:hypothetical protein
VYIRCGVAVLFTCTAVRPVRKGEHEIWVVGVNSKILGGPRQTRRMLTSQSNRSLSSTLDWGHEERICEVLQEDGHSSMYRTMIVYLFCKNKLSWVICNMLSVINYDYSMICKPILQYWPMFIFRRLKINHDSHEFILEFGTCANNNHETHVIISDWIL